MFWNLQVGITDYFDVLTGVRQRCVLPPCLVSPLIATQQTSGIETRMLWVDFAAAVCLLNTLTKYNGRLIA